VLAAARVALHRSACSRGIQAVERGMTPKSLYVCVCVVFECVCLVHCHRMDSSPLSLSRVPPSPFIVCKERGRVTTFGCTKIERECPKVLPIPSFPPVHSHSHRHGGGLPWL
jgi:hypothetical protein